MSSPPCISHTVTRPHHSLILRIVPIERKTLYVREERGPEQGGGDVAGAGVGNVVDVINSLF